MGDESARVWDWVRLTRLFAWGVAVAFLAATVILVLMESGLTTPEEPGGNPDLAQGTLEFFKFASSIWPQELAQRLLFTVGFLFLAGLGLALGRVIGSDSPRSFAVIPIVFAGAVAVTVNLLTIGAKSVAIDPHFCDCKHFAEQIIARGQALGMVESAEQWVLYGIFVMLALGAVLLGRVAIATGLFTRGWAYLAYAIGALVLVAMVLQIFDLEDPANLAIALVAGILTPIWTIWLGRQLKGRSATATS
jgi:uncharacterized membrane protein (DUF485 family)